MPDVSTDLRVFNDFERNPELLKKFDKVLEALSAAAIFADVQYRTGVMDSAIKPAFRAKVTGQAVTVQLSKGDLVDPLKALEMGQEGDVIVVDAGGDLTRTLGMEFTAPPIGLYGRSNRYAVVLDDGVITHANVDKPGECAISRGEELLETL